MERVAHRGDPARRAAEPGGAALPLRFPGSGAVRGAGAARGVPRPSRGRAARQGADDARRRRRSRGRGHRAPRGRARRERVAGACVPADHRRAGGRGPGPASAPSSSRCSPGPAGNEVYALLEARMPGVPPRPRRRALQPHHLVHPPCRRRPVTGARAPRATRPGCSSTTRPSWRTWWPWWRRRCRRGRPLDISTGG